MAYKGLVALTISSLLIGSIGFVAPRGRTALAVAPTLFHVAPSGENATTPDDTCANPDYGADSFPNGAEGAIEAAISAADPGATIVLCAGVFSLTTGEVDVTTTNLSFEGSNSASAGDTVVDGGGLVRLFDASGVATISFQNLTLRDGDAGLGNGGAILGQTVQVGNSLLEGNAASQGGAVYATGDVTVDRSTFVGNSTPNNGGAIYAYRASGPASLTATNSTFVSNVANLNGGSGVGGALLALSVDDSATLTAINVTFADDSAGSLGYGDLVGVMALGSGSTATLAATDSIFAGGTCYLAGDTTDPQNTGANFRTDATCPGTSVTSGDLKLAPLADNGGPTPTVALGFGSVAIDPGAPTGTFLTDQRGRTRPFAATSSDSGAYEYRVIRVKPDSGPGTSDPSCTFTTIQAAVNAADPGETVHLCEGDHSAGSSLGSGVTVGTNLTIEGDGSANTIVLGNGTFQLFHGSGHEITLRDLTLSGGLSFSGGAIDALDLTAIDVRFIDNHSINVGGAIRADGSASLTRVLATGNVGLSGGVVYAHDDLTIADSDLTANTADSGSGYGGVSFGYGSATITRSQVAGNSAAVGGAIATYGNVSVTGGDFIDNTAGGGSGGAIYGIGTVLVEGTHFLGNRSTSYGGAVFAQNAFSATDGEFVGNFSVDQGGAVYAGDGPTLVDGGSFLENTSGTGSGGAIGSNGPVTLAGVTFLRNHATGYGGAVWADDSGPVSGSLVSTGGIYEENRSENEGGALASDRPIIVDGGIFTRNSAFSDGGAICSPNGSVTVTTASTDGTFTENTADTGTGGAIATDGRVELDGADFIRNHADDWGGAVVSWSGSIATTDGTWEGNDTTVQGGGAIAAWAGSATVDGDAFSANGSAKNGGAIAVGGAVVVSDGTFDDNEASENGGAIYAGGAVSSVNGSYSDNTAWTGSGGAIFSNTGSISSVSDVFYRNWALGYGGALFAYSGSVSSTEGTYEENTAATYAGGAISASTDVSSDHDTFTRNRANTTGGAVNALHDVSSTDGTYEDNVAADGTYGGGAIYAEGYVVSSSDEFRRNLALHDGGAIYARYYDVSSTDGIYEDNTAATGSGGAIYVSSADQHVWSVRDHFARNLANGSGGAIMYPAGPVSAIGSYFEENTAATGTGGAISALGAVTIEAAVGAPAFVRNVAGDAGGAVYSYNETVSTTGGVFADNSAGAGGGAIRTGRAGGVAVSVTGSTFSGNRGTYGGAIDSRDAEVDSTDAHYEGNVAFAGDGGAIYAPSQTVHLQGGGFLGNAASGSAGAVVAGSLSAGAVHFTENTANTANGGAIVVDGAVDITSSTFARNRASVSGGAIAGPSTLSLVNSTLAGNTAGTELGGAIYTGGAATTTNVTFTDNTSDTGTYGLLFVGSLTTTDTIFDGGTCYIGGLGASPAGANFQTDPDLTCVGSLVTHAALHLGSLGHWGGPTETVPLLGNSVAIDPPGAANTQTVDQRGIPRPASWGDAGAYERTTGTHVEIYGPADATVGQGITFTVSVSSGDAEVTGGTLSLSDGTTPLGTCDLTAGTHGFCTFTTEALGAGTRTLVGSYSGTSGDREFDADQSTFTIVINVAPKVTYYVNPATVSSSALRLPSGGKGLVGTYATGCAVADFGSIQAALDYAENDGIDHNVVHICAGTYELSAGISITTGDNTAGLVIEGDHSSDTTIDGMGTYRIFDVDSSDGSLDLTIRELTLTRGAVDYGGALYWSTGTGSLTIESSRLTYNGVTGTGGALHLGASVPLSIVGSLLADNSAGSSGGAIYSYGTVSVTDTRFERNLAVNHGGAIHAAVIRGLRAWFERNVAVEFGGAIAYLNEYSTVPVSFEFTASTFVENSAGTIGGAIAATTDGPIDVALDAADFSANTALVDPGALGGAVWVSKTTTTSDSSLVTVRGGTYRDNQASSAGGAFWGGGVGGTTIDVGDAYFSGNVAATGDGGAILTNQPLEISGSTFVRNVAGSAGGAIWSFAPVTATNSTFVENSAGTSGGAIEIDLAFHPITLVYVTLKSDTSGDGTALNGSGVITTQSIFAGDVCGGPVTATGANFATDPTCVTTNVTSVTTGDLKLGNLADNGGPTPTIALPRASVAVEPVGGQTTCDVATDQRGVSRPQGSICDAGAFELTGITRLTLELLDNPQYYGRTARFKVSVTDGTHEVTSGTLSLSEGTKTLGTCTLAPGLGGTCTFDDSAYVRSFFVGRHQLTAYYSGSTDGTLYPSTSSGDQYILRNSATLLYIGQTYFVPKPAYVTLEAVLGDLTSGSGCGIAGKTVRFYSDTDGSGAYAKLLGSATTGPGGYASYTTGDITTGINEILVSFDGDGTCEPAVNTASLLADASGGTSSGGGWYTVPGSGAGKINFAYTISTGSYKLRGVDYTTITGSLVWHANGKFRVKGTITGYYRYPAGGAGCPSGFVASPESTLNCAYITGFGTISMWSLLPNGKTSWVPIATGIGFQVTVGDGGEPPAPKGNGNGKGNGGGGGGKVYTDWFRMNIPTAVVIGETLDGNAVKNGNIVVR